MSPVSCFKFPILTPVSCVLYLIKRRFLNFKSPGVSLIPSFAKPYGSILCFLLPFMATYSFSNSLAEADSLFKAKKFTESFNIYHAVLHEQRQVSPAMLLKMAYIKEGLGNNVDALYYLNLYYLHTADKKVLEKLQTLAEKSDVQGYDFSDFEFIQTLFYKFFIPIAGLIAALSIVMLALAYYMKMVKQSNPALPSAVMVLSLMVLFYVINYGRSYDKAIVSDSQAYLMSGPSSAAKALHKIKKGTRMTTYDQTDVWTRVETEDRQGFIKTEKLRYITY